MRRFLFLALGALFLVLALGAYVGARVARELTEARSALPQVPTDLRVDDLERAESDLRQAQQVLTSLPARLLDRVPMIGANLDAARMVIESAIPVAAEGKRLAEELVPMIDEGLVRKGRIPLEEIASLEMLLRDQSRALDGLSAAADDARGGWLLPPVWERIDLLRSLSEDAAVTADDAATLTGMAPELLGADGTRRRYVVLLLNNAELRGAGGILTGVGTITAQDGRLGVGEFQSVHDLREYPPRRVPAPEDFQRRFGNYKADTTLWLNTSWSPDVPDVGLVASRLLDRTTGRGADGAVIADPRGLAALIPPEEKISLPHGDSLRPRELPRFVYSDAYTRFTDQEQRREAILDLGEAAISEVLGRGSVDEDALPDVGAALAGGHLRLVSFDRDAATVLESLGVSGELSAPPGTYDITVAAQNLGSDDEQGTKLDYWARRHVRQECDVEEEEAECVTVVTLTNDAPSDLPTYVAGEPYGLLRSFVEIYIPDAADIEEVTLDGEPVEVHLEADEGHQAAGVFLDLQAGDSATLAATYRLPVGPAFRLRLSPQPLARDADLELRAKAPPGWTWTQERRPIIERVGRLSAPVEITAVSDERSGLAAWWDGLLTFLEKPIF